MGLLLGATFALSASADPKAEADKAGKPAKPEASAASKAAGPATPAANPKEKPAGATPAATKAELKADKAELKADMKADKAELKADMRADKAELKADMKADKDSPGHDGKHPGAGHARHGHFKSAMAKLRDRYKDGSLKKDELKKELEALKADRKQRREQHREALKVRWGNSLAAPAVREELKHHERRMAHLNRMLLVAETERKGQAKDKLVERIEKLRDQENERHERKMSQLQSTAAHSEKGINVPASTTTTPAAAPPGKAAVETGAKK
jgi:hypothetical protein